ncbi:hypothetical protein [Actinomadura violacea]|uniref:Uncharacterized protein n=1 Tax=Actinomadura violacea TaxID=2819934 RepID=A0ABS3S4V6_9ACTN|nr:hypothetical protein [Actinomadura violacea]MBO2463997.1 hypothetical protein [Actinomadura violacea]
MHRQDPDRLLTANLFAAATRLAGWKRPEEKAWKAAVAELERIATVRERRQPSAVHEPPATLRADLLAEVAGILIGAAPDSYPEQNLIAADLLREAGAPEDIIQRWIPVGRERREGGGAPFSKAAPARPPTARKPDRPAS